MRKRFCIWALALIMTLCLMSTLAMADGEAVTTIDDLESALLTGGNVTLGSNLEFSTDDIITIPEGVTVVFDMNGYSITVEDDFVGRPIVNYGNLTMTGNGTIDSSNSEFGGYGAINNFGQLTIENGTYKGNVCADGAAVYNREGGTSIINGGHFDACRAVSNDGTMTIYNGTFYTTSCNQTKDSDGGTGHWSYCVGSAGTLYFYNGTVTGVQGALAIYDGYAEIYDGTFTTTTCEHTPNGSASFYAIYVAGEVGETEAHVYGGTYTAAYRHAVYCGNDNPGGDGGIRAPAVLYIHDGTFTGGSNAQAAVYQAPTTGHPSITGGTYLYSDGSTTHASNVSQFIPQGAALNWDSKTGEILVDDEIDTVASVDGVGYTSLQNAIDAAPEGGTVTLLKDIDNNNVGTSTSTDTVLSINIPFRVMEMTYLLICLFLMILAKETKFSALELEITQRLR